MSYSVRKSVKILTVILSVALLPACQSAYYASRNVSRDIMTSSDFLRAVSALDAKDLNAAQGFVTGEAYKHRYKEIRGSESWGSLQYRASKIVVTAAISGKKVQDDALYLSYVNLFEVGEGLPDHPEEMLGYMHKAVAMLIANPKMLDNLDSNLVSKTPSQFTMEKYAVWQYLSDGGEINWKKPAPEGEGYSIAGVSYSTWHILLKKALWNRGDIFVTSLGKSQFIHDSIDYSLFPQVACVAQRKHWKLTLPDNYQFQNFRGGGAFDMNKCERVD